MKSMDSHKIGRVRQGCPLIVSCRRNPGNDSSEMFREILTQFYFAAFLSKLYFESGFAFCIRCCIFAACTLWNCLATWRSFDIARRLTISAALV